MRIGLGKYFMTGCVTGIPVTGPRAVWTSGLNLRAGLYLKADSGNTGIVYIGDSGVSQIVGYPLQPGNSEFFRVDEASGVFLLANVTSQKCFWFAT